MRYVSFDFGVTRWVVWGACESREFHGERGFENLHWACLIDLT